ncbi:hypothetical protein AALO_G00273340 [Alosa alosa]|uniref:Alkylated DNA repair protein AlkB homologue 8 N-terminal domain-containing protein n=1 Tax=Alosa alosa TaxID=278164 RepID=A0AAV6FSL2_9TELE|nr:hypothetical protein AALO_G00273340 [Alosa alosa]
MAYLSTFSYPKTGGCWEMTLKYRRNPGKTGVLTGISEDLSWTTNTASLAKRAQRRLYFLRKLRRASAPPAIMTTFYRGTIESILSSCIAV